MKKLLMIIFFLSIIINSNCFTIQNSTGRFDVGIGYGLTSIYLNMNSFELHALYNTNEVFYIGARFLYFNSYSYESIIPTTGYNTSFNDISLLFGMQFGNFNERFQFVLNLLAGFAFAERQYGDISTFDPVILKNTLNNENLTFFSPSFEFGLNCYLTQNFIINSTLSVKLVRIKDMDWEHRPWLIQLGEEDAFLLYIPVRLAWRF
ncbi:MAG: hypothetical protein N3E50_02615 [Candidatus Goldbacteria bacterium]|nr:hypothetical protein [Candidatus Goldiibacteriota bacterium]